MKKHNAIPEGWHDGKLPTPYLVIPYFSGDSGVRPLPADHPSWLCSSILVDGSPYIGRPLRAGVEVKISVVVANQGALGAAVTLRLYRSDPTAAFTPLAVRTIAQTVYYVPSGVTLESPSMRWVPDRTLSHSCLLAEATCALDPSRGTLDAINDRHYGQQNVIVSLGDPSYQVVIQVYVSNPHRTAEKFRIRACPATDKTLNRLERVFNSKAVAIRQEHVSVGVVEPRLGTTHAEVAVDLKPLERRLCSATIVIPDGLVAGQFVAGEIEQTRVDVKGDAKLMGTIGLIAFVHHTAQR